MTDPITREQVERLLADTLAGGNAFSSFYRSPQRELAPAYVLGAWEEDGGLRDVMEPALTRWHDELAAAEPVRRVARWDADADHYVLTPPYTHTYAYVGSTTKRETAIAWGYEIEGGPGPVAHHAASERVVERLRAMTPADGLAALVEAGIVTPDGELTDAYRARPEPAEDSPERLRERREALGWTLDEAADAINASHEVEWSIDDIATCETGGFRGVARARYAAALSAEEERRATVAAECCAECGYLFGALTGDDGPGDAPVVRSTGKPDTCTNCAPERPAPRFKVGDWVQRPGSASFKVADVPQPAAPVVKRCDTVTASWTPGKGHLTVRTMVRDMDVPIALLRAMLEAIDAQQGGAS